MKKEFGKVVREGWQLDCFGHAGVHGALSALAGMDSVFFSRMDTEVGLEASAVCCCPWGCYYC